ncbi:PIN2/TERF1-interacting telomerase inhibitor 1-like [Aquarana catesbeiana]|uniref:PIN2/TERF1-interacting telomerase inhibitor 1-like n=1 Tax=Aquarana catesbeiana TaxID=8400 RepID=UPI003CC9F0C5
MSGEDAQASDAMLTLTRLLQLRDTRQALVLSPARRKQKCLVDPRNSAWTNDDSKFGQKMLEKKVWSKGRGLGAQEQGSMEHIKVQVKNNTLGLGACNNYEDKWIAHQEDFNQLLAELNDCHGTASTDSPANDSKKSLSLEKKSKTSKKRVHYMKFAKGKFFHCVVLRFTSARNKRKIPRSEH